LLENVATEFADMARIVALGRTSPAQTRTRRRRQSQQA
jgi:hypothetical protein